MSAIRKPLKTELHHWWPRSLQEHWCDDAGNLAVVRPDGSIRFSKPGNFGAITNAHHMKIGGPWDSTFEPIFNRPDSEIGDLVCWLYTLEANEADPAGPILPRITAQPLTDDRRHQLARTIASLVARSPRTRNTLQRTTDFFRGEEAATPEERKKDEVLVAMNQRGLYDAYRKRLETGGRWAVLFSDTSEFIFGDGFLHNFPASSNPMHSGAKCVVPITPTATLVSMLPTSHPSEPALVTIKLRADEVNTLNHIVQAYSRHFLFYRSHRPALTEDFTCGQFKELRYHRHTWLDDLLDNLAQYNLWGPGGTPSRIPKRTDHFDLEAFMERHGIEQET